MFLAGVLLPLLPQGRQPLTNFRRVGEGTKTGYTSQGLHPFNIYPFKAPGFATGERPPGGGRSSYGPVLNGRSPLQAVGYRRSGQPPIPHFIRRQALILGTSSKGHNGFRGYMKETPPIDQSGSYRPELRG